MVYELLWVEGVEEDLRTNFDDNFCIKIISKLQFIANSKDPFLLTDRIQGFPSNIRKLKLSNFRLFLDIRKVAEIIYCLAIINRNEAYKSKSLKHILTISRNIKQPN